MASTSVVLPWSTWAMMAILRICVVKLFHPYVELNWLRGGAALAARE